MGADVGTGVFNGLSASVVCATLETGDVAAHGAIHVVFEARMK